MKGSKQVKPIARKAVRGCITSINFAIDALTSPKAKELYKNVGVLLSVLWAILWWVVTFLWEIADGALEKLVVDRCLKLPPTGLTPPADLKPVRPIVPAGRKVQKVVKHRWNQLNNLLNEAKEAIAEVPSYAQSRQLKVAVIYALGSMSIALTGGLIDLML